MLILSQDRETLVNVNNVSGITIVSCGGQYYMRAWEAGGVDDFSFFCIGRYQSEERCKEVLREIWLQYGTYYHRPASPAVLKGTTDLPEVLFNYPKIYEMPEE